MIRHIELAEGTSFFGIIYDRVYRKAQERAELGTGEMGLR